MLAEVPGFTWYWSILIAVVLVVGWGGFFVMDKKIGDYLTDDTCVLEKEPLQRLACEGKIKAYKHDGFWQCMDNIREREYLDELWASGKAPWKIWS